MISIVKGNAPAVLLNAGANAAATHRADYDKDPKPYDDGRKTFDFKAGVYGHQTVRSKLEEDQHGKCAYCEVVVPKPYADGHIDHWRPKGAVTQKRGATPVLPGYYWLAYCWDNLLLACQFCNRSNKKTLFPLADPAKRAANHHVDLTVEGTLLLKPDVDTDLDAHIEFVEELPVGRTPRGQATVEVLGLDRLEHRARDMRIAALRDAHAQAWIFAGDPHPAAVKIVSDARRLYAEAPLPQSPFSAMARTFIAANPLPA